MPEQTTTKLSEVCAVCQHGFHVFLNGNVDVWLTARGRIKNSSCEWYLYGANFDTSAYPCLYWWCLQVFKVTLNLRNFVILHEFLASTPNVAGDSINRDTERQKKNGKVQMVIWKAHCIWKQHPRQRWFTSTEFKRQIIWNQKHREIRWPA